MQMGKFLAGGGNGGPLYSIGTLHRELCKTDEPIEMQLGMLNGVGAGNYVLDAVQMPPQKGTLCLGVCGRLKSIVKHIRFWATISKTVRRMLSDRCLSCLSVCPIRLSCLSVTLVLWPNG